MTIYLYSDPHFWHTNVITYCDRPFRHPNGDPNVEEMNEALVRNWNSVVKPEDTVYCLGDFSFAIRPVELFSERLMGNKKLVPGNHDPVHPFNKHYKKALKRGQLRELFKKYEDLGWEILPLETTLDIPGVAVVNMSHMPYDTTDPRYVEYVPNNDGRWLLCGHIHQHWKVKDKMINCGVDVWNYTPVSIDEISKIILNSNT